MRAHLVCLLPRLVYRQTLDLEALDALYGMAPFRPSNQHNMTQERSNFNHARIPSTVKSPSSFTAIRVNAIKANKATALCQPGLKSNRTMQGWDEWKAVICLTAVT